jgi:hypothetical protein
MWRRASGKDLDADSLAGSLRDLADLLHKYGHRGQADVAEKILASLKTDDPDYTLLTSLSMWGGSGAVWEVCLVQGSKSSREARDDEAAFRRSIIQIAKSMDRLKIGNARSRDIARIFQGWIDRGI